MAEQHYQEYCLQATVGAFICSHLVTQQIFWLCIKRLNWIGNNLLLLLFIKKNYTYYIMLTSYSSCFDYIHILIIFYIFLLQFLRHSWTSSYWEWKSFQHSCITSFICPTIWHVSVIWSKDWALHQTSHHLLQWIRQQN